MKHLKTFEQFKTDKTMTYSANKIAKFIDENVSLQPNSLVKIWEGPNGLTYTRGSMEYRDDEHTKVLAFRTMDEVPANFSELKRSVEFQINQQ